jgi:predicted DNA binding protein
VRQIYQFTPSGAAVKRLRIQITHTEETIHPVHEFEIRHAAFHGSELLHWNPSAGDTSSMIYRVRGDPDSYGDRLDGRDATRSYTIAPAGDSVFHCCVCERLTDRDHAYVRAVLDRPVVMVPPVTYGQDWTVGVTVVGSAAAVDGVLGAFPDAVSVDVRSITDYRSRVPGTLGALTERQREAVAAAVESGYYESPRRGAVGDVAAKLGVSTSTAAEHLRKAEARVMGEICDRP